MKVCVKRVFCPVCRKLVSCHEQKVDGHTQVWCAGGHALRAWNGVRWRVLKTE